MIDNFETIFYSAMFIVPGYILYSTLQTLVPRTKLDIINSTLKFLTATLIHYIMWSWLIYLMFSNEHFKTNMILLYISSIIIIVISPFSIGLLLAKLSDKDIVIKLLRMVGYNPINPIPTAWDYKFSKTLDGCWIIVTLKNGDSVYGKFGTSSFAASETTERDLYIEELYTLRENGNWVKRDRTNGILILNDEIKHIEFLEN